MSSVTLCSEVQEKVQGLQQKNALLTEEREAKEKGWKPK